MTGRGPADVRIFLRLFAMQLNSQLRYRSDFLFGSVGLLLDSVTRFIALMLMLTAVGSLGDWTAAEVAMLQGFVMASSLPAPLFDAFWSLPGALRSGDFVQFMLRPFSPLLHFSSSVLSLNNGLVPVAGVLLFLTSSNAAGIEWNLRSVLAIASGWVGATLIYTALLIASGSVAFWSYSLDALQTQTTVRSLAPFPISLFTRPLQFLFKFVIPLAFLAWVPVEAVRGERVDLTLPIAGVFIGVVACRIAAAIFYAGARHNVLTAT